MTKVTGELISIDDSAYDGFKGMTVYGNTVQNLWVNPSGTKNGVTVTSNANGSVTLSGTPNVAGSSPTISSAGIFTLKPNTTYIAFSDKEIADEYASDHGACFYVSEYQADGTYITDKIFAFTGNLSIIFTADSMIGFATCRITVRPNTTVSGTYRIMLREATAEEIAQDKVLDTTWCPSRLSSIDNVKVVTAGKNYFPRLRSATSKGITVTANSDGSYTLNGTSLGSDAGAELYNVSGIPKGHKLTLSSYGYDARAVKVQIYYDVPGETRVYQDVFETPKTFTIPESVRNIGARVVVGRQNETVDNVTVYPQLELGSTATSYEPPNITTTPIDLDGHTLNALPDGTRDELHVDGGGNVVLEKRVGVATAPTSAGSWFWETAGDGIASFTLPAKSTGTKTDMTGVMRCDKLPIRQVPGEAAYAIVGTTQGHAKTPAITSAATAATVAGGATYLYQLATPQTIQLGKISLPKLRKNPLVNSIWVNGTAAGTGFSLAPEIDYEYNRWSTYCDGFKTHGKHSYFDMGCCIAARDTGTPEKKSVTATVPYMSGFYDLSKLYGAIAFEARQLMYRFEFVEDSREELQQKKSQFLEWLSQVHDEEIADDDIPGRHFIGSLSEWEFEEGEEGQSGSLEVTFNCQPFLEADKDTTKTCNAGSNTVTVEGQAVNAYAKTSSGTATIRIGGVTQSVGTTEIRLSVQLQPGDNAVTVTGSPVVLRWKELTA